MLRSDISATLEEQEQDMLEQLNYKDDEPRRQFTQEELFEEGEKEPSDLENLYDPDEQEYTVYYQDEE